MKASRAIVCLDAFLRNFHAARRRLGQGRQLCVPVKADAYGHGALEIARASIAAGASCLAVACVQEGAALREGGICAQVLLFSQPLPEEIPEIIENELIPLVSDSEFVRDLEKAAQKKKMQLPVHLKIDSGMGRMGCAPEEALALARQITASPALSLEGTATHFAAADSAAPGDIAYTERQIARFNRALDEIRAGGINPGIVHAANSGAVLLHPAAWYDMARPGILLYGYNLAQGGEAARGMEPLQVEPVMELRSKVVLIKQLKKGESVSYGMTWKAQRDTAVAVLPIGYADGLPRLASNKWQFIINGKQYPLAGRICMDHCMADLGPASDVRRWDDAVIFGGPAPGADALAECAGSIAYEITCNINKRVPRVYMSSKQA